ncbi:MAG: hypothetical protein K2Y29_00910 [Beijerinckiaceae bacterium]|nr:hypothetical protein [Beijerinckiaceae bacterium]
MTSTILLAMLGNLLTLFPGGGTYLFTPPAGADVSVRRGGSVVIYNVRAYETDPTCRPLPPVQAQAYPRPQLGSVSTTVTSVVSDGPCGVRRYPIRTVTYTAGSTSGVDSFQLYFFMGDREASRDQRAVNVYVR